MESICLSQQTHTQMFFLCNWTVSNMAFRSVPRTLTLLLFLFCQQLLTDKMTAAVGLIEKCMCLTESKTVAWRRITDFEVIDSGPHCNKVQIIVHVQGDKDCLAPNSKPGKRLQKCWKRINFNEKKKKDCLQSVKIKKRPKKTKKTKKP